MNQEISNMFHIVSTLSDRVQTFLCKYANMAKKWQQCRFNGSSCKKSPQPSYIALFLSLYRLFEQKCKKSSSILILSSFFLSIVFSNKDETFLFLWVIWIVFVKKVNFSFLSNLNLRSCSNVQKKNLRSSEKSKGRRLFDVGSSPWIFDEADTRENMITKTEDKE